MNRELAIELLRDDEQYYNGIGRDYYSNSDITNLLNGSYTKDITNMPWNKNFEFGKVVHTAILEPHKLSNFKTFEGTRAQKAYKELGYECLTRSERDKADACIDAINKHRVARGLLYGPEVEYEKPGIAQIEDTWWKGKADAYNKQLNLVVDIKTSSGMMPFEDSCYKWGYTSQAWIYWKLFNAPIAFVVVNKRDYSVEVYEFPVEFYRAGKERVYDALKVIKSINNVVESHN